MTFKARKGIEVGAGKFLVNEQGDVAARVVNQIVNVKSFGAKGDSVTDDSNAVSLAAEHCIQNGGILFFPRGDYRHPTYTIPDTIACLYETGELIQSNRATFKFGTKQPLTNMKKGHAYFDTTTNALMVYDGTAWVQFARKNGSETIDGNLTVTGDLLVQGDNVILNVAQLEVEDNIITLNRGVTGSPTLDSGIEVQRGTAPKAKVIFDETEDVWKLDNGNGVLSRISHGGAVNVKDFGAKGDGVTDDTAAIQRAIDKVATYAVKNPLSGGVVVIPEDGTFLFTQLLVRSNVTLKGMGGVLKLKDNVCVDANVNYYPIHTMGQNNVTLDGLVIDGNSANNMLAKVADTLTITGDNHSVRSCKLYNAVDSGIMFSSCKRSSLVDNVIQTGRDLGIYVNDGTGDTHYENVIIGNRIQGFAYGGIGLKRLCQKTVVASNTISECGNGITLEYASTLVDYSKDVTITGNRLRRIGYNTPESGKPTPAGVGIQLLRSHYVVVTNNRLDDIAKTAIGVTGTEHASVTNNVITMTQDSDQQSQGFIFGERDGEPSRYNKVLGNIVTGARRFGFRFSSSVTSQYNDVKNNTVVMGTNPLNAAYAMRVEAGWVNNNFSENTLNGQYDLEVFSGAYSNNFSNTVLVNNLSSGSIDQNLQTVYLRLKDKRVSCGTSAPTNTTMRWEVGDTVYNIAPTYGSPTGWVCTTSGSPGTWEPIGFVGGQEKQTSLPTASASQRGRIVRIEGSTGVADSVYVCVKKADDSYDWAQLF